ncbi:MAG TPA: hypothetical protein VNB22_10440 [Pyrinomonadaceae bacterium]|nr:hypothetical protein [Pyrinomonadaceae bacterium]
MNRLTAQRLCFLFLFLLTLTFSANGQQENNPVPRNTPETADESFTLNITESRTSETNYERSTQVETGGVQNGTAVEVRVGAGVRAQNIVITLRGITGNVRFRATLEKIRRLLIE